MPPPLRIPAGKPTGAGRKIGIELKNIPSAFCIKILNAREMPVIMKDEKDNAEQL